MEIKVLWYDGESPLSEAASAALLQQHGIETTPVHVRTAPELAMAIKDGEFQCAVVVHARGDESWREVLRLLSTVSRPIPIVIFLDEESAELHRDALLAGAWHAAPRSHEDLCAAALKCALLHAVTAEEHRKMTESLRKMETVLQSSQRSIALGVLLGSIAHEINNPLEGITNLLYLARRADKDSEMVQKCIDMSESELSRVSEITKQMLRFHRDTRAPQELRVAELLDGILTLFTAKLRERQIEVRRKYESSGWMMGYPGELRQAFLNLIANAVDAMESGGRITLRIRERRRAPFRLCVTIADSGKGMPRRMVNQLGNLFATTKGDGGTGIGLWVTRRIVHKHQGSFRVYSSEAPGRSGTVFTLCFPRPAGELPGSASPRHTIPSKMHLDDRRPDPRTELNKLRSA